MSTYGNAGNILSAGDIVKNYPHGKFIQMDDVVCYVLSCEFGGKGTRNWITITVRELLNEEISTILIGWNTTDAVPVYTITYMTKTSRPGAKKEEGYSLYSLKVKNPTFKVLDIDLRTCLYKGDHVCIDLKNGEKYSFAHSTAKIKNELSRIQVGDIVSTCKYQNRECFIASYARSNPAIKIYEDSKRIILKKETGYKWTTAEPGKQYRVYSFEQYNMRAEYEYRRISWKFSVDVCEEAEIAYGYAQGLVYGGEKVVLFTNIADSKMYTVPTDSVSEENFKALCEDTYIVRAHIVKSKACQAYIGKVYMTEVLDHLEYVYDDEEEGAVCYMSLGTYDLYDIPYRYLPKGIKTSDILYGSTAKDDELEAVDPKGRIFALNKKKKG